MEAELDGVILVRLLLAWRRSVPMPRRSRSPNSSWFSRSMCVSKGQTICAPFNTTSVIGKPTTQNSTTNPIGFVYSYTNSTTNTKVYIDITRCAVEPARHRRVMEPDGAIQLLVINTLTGQTTRR